MGETERNIDPQMSLLIERTSHQCQVFLVLDRSTGFPRFTV